MLDISVLNESGTKLDISASYEEAKMRMNFQRERSKKSYTTIEPKISIEVSPNSEKRKKIQELISLFADEIKENIVFDEFKTLFFNASLVMRHSISNGEIYLGSNQYKHKATNIEFFDDIFNVIGELPEKSFDKTDVKVEVVENNQSKIKERIVVTKSNHKTNFFVLENESFLNYPYLCDMLYKSFIKGNKILIHCEQGLVRSAGLLLFYLRRYFFDSLEDANDFIGLKREMASASNVAISICDKIIRNLE